MHTRDEYVAVIKSNGADYYSVQATDVYDAILPLIVDDIREAVDDTLAEF